MQNGNHISNYIMSSPHNWGFHVPFDYKGGNGYCESVGARFCGFQNEKIKERL